MNVNRYMTTTYTQSVGIPQTGTSHDSFDTLWSCIFNLEPTKITTREIWFVQNQNEKRTSTQLQLRQKLMSVFGTNKMSGSSSMSPAVWWELLAYVGGIWYVLSQMVLGPLVKKYVTEKKLMKEIGIEVFHQR